VLSSSALRFFFLSSESLAAPVRAEAAEGTEGKPVSLMSCSAQALKGLLDFE